MEMNTCSKCNGTGKVPGRVGATMKTKRRKALLSQRQVAEAMGIDVGQLSRLEHDKEVWSRQRMDRYNAALAALRNGAK